MSRLDTCFGWCSISFFVALHMFSLLFLSSLISLAFFVLWIYMTHHGLPGETLVLPVIGPIAAKAGLKPESERAAVS